MKKLFALLFACSMITCVFTACGDETTESSIDTESSVVSDEISVDTDGDTDDSTYDDTESDVEEDSTPIEIVPGTAGDENLIGAWTNDDLSSVYSSIKFNENGVASTLVDCSSMMSISDGNLILSEVECPYEFDGTTFSSVMTAESMGLSEDETEDMEVMVMDKLEPTDETDLNGTYLLTGGLMYDSYSSSLPVDGDIYVIISDDNLYMDVEVCGYDSDGTSITWKGDAQALFSLGDDESAVCTYVIDGDTLTITSPSGEEEVMTRNDILQ